MLLEIIVPILLLIFFAGVFHGALGFGFPMLSTPVLTLAYDLKTAVLMTILPSCFVIMISLYQCKNVKKGIGENYLIIITTATGSVFGAWFLIWADVDILKLLLAFSICLYLFSGFLSEKLKVLSNKKYLFPIIMGGCAGLIGGATNAVAPLLMIYLLESKKSPKEIVFISNVCFMLSKIMQILILSSHTDVNKIDALSLLYITAFACFGLFFGFRIQSKISSLQYRKIVRYILTVFMFLIIYQSLSNLLE